MSINDKRWTLLNSLDIRTTETINYSIDESVKNFHSFIESIFSK